MKPNKIYPIRECSCCYETILIDKEIFNCPNTKCTYVLCKNCIMNLGKKTNSDQCPACRVKLPIHYKPIEIVTEITPRPGIIIMRRNGRSIPQYTSIEHDCGVCIDESIDFCDNITNMSCVNIKKCCKECKQNACSVFQILFMIIIILFGCFGVLFIGHMVSYHLYPFIYCCVHEAVSFILGGIFGIMTLLIFITCLTFCGKCCILCYGEKNNSYGIHDNFIL
uniref:RING-type domain-containing protein n=1 Tax=viral metagenome TaxID=1070528 RepID=A0A6C0CNT3_9ZZZZ